MQSRPSNTYDELKEHVSLTNELMVSMSTAVAALGPDQIVAAATLIELGLREKRKILLLGNGGSCATASHLATDLTLIANEARLHTSIAALNDNASLLSAMANDYGFAESGTALIENAASEGDILVIFSCSARSPNLICAAQAAARLGVVTLLIGSSLAPADFPAQVAILVESERYSVIETAHVAVVHLLADLVRLRFGIESVSCSRSLPQDSKLASD
jgi:D-sedoheptulose 7-phosphate isomerase